MRVKCDYCGTRLMECELCHPPVPDFKDRDHYHTCDLDCAEGISEIHELEDSYGDKQ